jgi:transcriptional regulator with XRE-family HTH domain
MPDWNKRLRAARRDLAISPGDLAARAGLSEASVRAYEMGRRHPTRDHLSCILDCLRLDRQSRNELFVAAGLAPDAIELPDGSMTRREAIRLIHDRPWPAFLMNDVMEIIAASRVGMRLARLTQKDLDDRIERSVLVVAARNVAPPASDRGLRDWGTLARRVMARMKAAGVGTLDRPDAYFAALLDRIEGVGPGLIRELTAQWEEIAPEPQLTVTWSYRAQWTLRDGATLRLFCVATRVNTQDLIEIHDLIAADATSAAMLERIASGPAR